MPRNTRTRPSEGASRSSTAAAPSLLVSLLARTPRLTDLLPHLHQHALEVTGGAKSLLFEHNPRNGAMQATSGVGLDTLRTDPWLPAPEEAALVAEAFRERAALLVNDADRQMPDLAARLSARSALLLPLSHGPERVGLLAIGFARAPAGAAIDVDAAPVADAFLAALELCRLRQREELARDLREVFDAFSEHLSSTLSLAAGLDIFCLRASRLFGADRTSVWIHDRRERHLVLQASSDPDGVARGARVDADDPLSPAAAAMRSARAESVAGADLDAALTSTVTVPLRGRRRALGTIVFEGVRVEPGGELNLLDRADELGRQLSSAIENMQLLDSVMQSRRELENAFDSIAHLVAVSDRRGRIVRVNEAFATRVDRSRDQLLDQPLTDFVGTELAAWLGERSSSTRPDGPVGPATREIVDPVLRGPFGVTVTDLVNNERERVGSVLVARDLTPQTQLEAEREELRRRLTQSEKLAALGQFVAGIAHELNNPLQGVLGHLELLRATGAFPKSLRREMQTIYREADRAAKIVRNLLVFAGSRRLTRRAVNLNSVLQKVIALRAPACRAAGIEVVRHYEDKLPRVPSDSLLLHQVFLNIVMNAEHAIAATGRGGRIEITTAVQPWNHTVVATIRDTGGGIASDALSRVFEPFYTTKEVGQGTGLGLAIAYGIVQEHGGQIGVSNHPQGGAILTVELPLTPAPERRPHD
jgi:signal transduction histidine kinase